MSGSITYFSQYLETTTYLPSYQALCNQSTQKLIYREHSFAEHQTRFPPALKNKVTTRLFRTYAGNRPFTGLVIQSDSRVALAFSKQPL